MCCEAWRIEQVPRDWMQGVIFPLYKDGDNRDPLNYRGITLLSIVGKVYKSADRETHTICRARRRGHSGRTRRVSPRQRNGGSVVCTYRDFKRERESENNVHSIY